MQIPTLTQAQAWLAEAESMNPGAWVDHSRYVAEGAQRIAAAAAARHPNGLQPEAAYILGLLHDVGRRAGVHDMRHAIDGYHYLHAQGCEDAARICITHSFPIPDAQMIISHWDATPEEVAWVGQYLAGLIYSDYDRLIQLCDALALPSGFCLMEKRLVDVTMRYGLSPHSVPRWKVCFALKAHFEQLIGASIYDVLPGVVENTFDRTKH